MCPSLNYNLLPWIPPFYIPLDDTEILQTIFSLLPADSWLGFAVRVLEEEWKTRGRKKKTMMLALWFCKITPVILLKWQLFQSQQLIIACNFSTLAKSLPLPHRRQQNQLTGGKCHSIEVCMPSLESSPSKFTSQRAESQLRTQLYHSSNSSFQFPTPGSTSCFH